MTAAMVANLDLLVLLGLALVCWVGKRRERRKADEDAAALRGRHSVDRAGWTSVGRL